VLKRGGRWKIEWKRKNDSAQRRIVRKGNTSTLEDKGKKRDSKKEPEKTASKSKGVHREKIDSVQ